MKRIFVVLGIAMLFVARIVCAYDMSSAVVFWVAVDDKTSKTSSVIQIWQNPKNLNYYGKIYKVFSNDAQKTVDRRNPMVGKVIITDMKYQNGQYVGGWVFDPRDGSKYHARMRVTEGGHLLSLRGYIGMPLLGRTAQWQRVVSMRP